MKHAYILIAASLAAFQQIGRSGRWITLSHFGWLFGELSTQELRRSPVGIGLMTACVKVMHCGTYGSALHITRDEVGWKERKLR